MISRLTRSRAVDLTSGLCDNLQTELQELSSDSDDDLSDVNISGLSLTDTPTDTATDGNEEQGTKKKKKKKKINAALQEKIRQELTGPSTFLEDPAVKKMMGKRSMR